jgi:replicative DNA helicase
MAVTREQIATLVDLEQSVLGGILLRNVVLSEIPSLEPGDFYDPRNRAVFAAYRALERDGKPIDTVLVEHELHRADKLEAIGGPGYLGDLALKVPTPENTCEYAARVRDAALGRRVAERMAQVVEEWRQGLASGADLLSMALAQLSSLDAEQPEEAKAIGDLVKARFQEFESMAEERARGGAAITGVPTGVAGLDAKLGGYQPGIVTILCGRPGHGKSSKALAAADAASEAGMGVHLFSLEDSWRSYTDRALARQSGVPAESMRAANLNAGDLQRIQGAASRLWRRQGWKVDDRSGITADEIIRSVRRHRKKNGTRLVIVDYVQLVRRPRGASEYEALGEIGVAFQTAAKQDGLAYLVLSQLNRELEKRADKRPQLSDLRGSGTLEEYCKAAVAVYRGSVYGGRPKREVDYDCDCQVRGECSAHQPTQDAWERQMQLLLIKNSTGQCPARVFAPWHGPTTRVA